MERRCVRGRSPVWYAGASNPSWPGSWSKVQSSRKCDRDRNGAVVVGGAYVATGHNVWGILNAPATGEAMAELIVDGKAHTLDLNPFDPIRLARGKLLL